MGEKNATAAARDRSLRAAQASSDAGKSEEARTADRGCGKPKQGAGDGSTNREKLSRTLTDKKNPARESLGRTEALTGVALGCFLAWVPMTFQSLNIVGDKGEPVLDTVYLISICTLLLTQILIGIEHRHCALWLAKRPARVGSAITMAASTLLLPVAAGWADGESAAGAFAASIALTTASGVVSGVSSGLFLAQFGILMSKFSAKATATIAALGYLCMSAFFCLFSFFGPLESCLFAASMPVISSFLRDTGASTQKGRAGHRRQAPSRANRTRQPGESTPTATSHAGSGAMLRAYRLRERAGAHPVHPNGASQAAGGQYYAFIQAGAALVIGLGATVIDVGPGQHENAASPGALLPHPHTVPGARCAAAAHPTAVPDKRRGPLRAQLGGIPVLRHPSMGPHLRRLPPVSSHQHPRIPIRSRRMDLRAFDRHAHRAFRGELHVLRACPGVPMRRAGRSARHDGGDGVHRARPGLRREPAPHGQEAALRRQVPCRCRSLRPDPSARPRS